MRALLFALGLVLAVLPATSRAEDVFKPYVLASEQTGTVASIAEATATALKEAGFTVVGEVALRDDAKIVAFTSPELKSAAASSEFGGFGAVMRASVTQAGDKVQVAFTNPPYLGNAYRLKTSLKPVRGKIDGALGSVREFGTKDGMTAEALREYHYMMAMPHFDDMHVVGEHASHAEALAAVRGALKANKAGTTKVYEVAIPGREEVVFGVAMWEGKGADSVVLGRCDQLPEKATVYAPYELLVSGNEVRTLHGRFRIALSFPDLSMGTFMKIVGAPPAIRDTMAALAAGPS